MERLAGEVHHRFGGREERPVVLDDQRVGELDLERAPARAGELGEPVGDLQGLLPLQVLGEVLRPRADLVVAEHVVQEAVHRLPAEQRRVELHGHVHVHLGEEEAHDPLDLARRAAMERRESDLVGEGGGEVDVAEAREVGRDLAAHRLHLGAGVLHRLDPAPHLRRPDAGEVVAHAHVQDRLLLEHVGGLPEQVRLLQDVDEHRAGHVLAQALREAQLLAPLDVVADGDGVDAGPGDHQPVVDLHGLQLEDPAPRQPRQHDVLRHLVLRARRGAERARRAMAVEEDRRVEVGRAVPELARGQVEDLSLALVLAEHPPQQVRERRGD